MAPSDIELVKRNERYAVQHEPIPTIAEIEAAGTPAPKTCIVTCVDPRVFPEQLLGLKWGEAFIFRTVAGRPQPIVQEIVGLDRVSHGWEDLILLYHTGKCSKDCGAMRFTNDSVRADVIKACPAVASAVEDIDFGAVSTSIEQRLRDDVKWLQGHAMLPPSLEKAIKGYMYDLKTGKIHRVA